MRTLNPLIHSASKALPIVREIIEDIIPFPGLDDSAAIWSNSFLRNSYDRFINIVSAKNPIFQSLGIEITSNFNESLILFMVYSCFSNHGDSKLDRKRATLAYEEYKIEFNRVSTL